MLHVTFGSSAAGSLKKALATLGRNDEFLYLADDLACGPINPVEPRSAWLADELGYDDDLISRIERFWNRIEAHRGDLIAWISRRYAIEYCGLLELLSRTQAVVNVVDVADVAFVGRDGAPSQHTSMAFAVVGDDQVVEHKLVDRAVPVSTTTRDAYLSEWQRLRDENAALRVMTAAGLISAPVTHFDDTILSCVTSEWQRCARIIGHAWHETTSGGFRQGGEDVLLYHRLLILMDEGLVEGRTDGKWAMSKSWVRLASR